MKLFTNSDDENTSLGVIERAANGMGNFANAFLFVLITGFLTYYYTNVIGLSAGVIGTIMLASRIFDGVTDLGMGWILDHTKTKFGKARLWVLRVALPYAIASIIMFAVPTGASDTVKYIFVFVTYNLTCTFLYTALSVAYSSTVVTMTRNSYERGVLGIISILVATASNIIVTSTALKLVSAFGGDSSAWTKTVVIYAFIGFICHLLFVFGIKERVQDDETKEKDDVKFIKALKILVTNKYWVMNLIAFMMYWVCFMVQSSAGLYYSQYVLGNTDYYAIFQNVNNIASCVACVVLFIPLKKYGKGTCYKVAAGATVLALAVQSVAHTSIGAIAFANIVRGIGGSVVCSCAVAINADALDYGEWKNGIKVVGMGVAVIGFCQKIGSGVGGGLLGMVLDAGGFDGMAATQSSSALTAITACYSYIPLVCYLVIFFAMLRYNLDKKFSQITADLQERRSK